MIWQQLPQTSVTKFTKNTWTRLTESVYEAAFVFELKKRSLQFDRQKDIPSFMKEKILVGFQSGFNY
jgi:hypothetical protein